MKIRKTIVSLALAYVMVLGLMPGMGMTALADVQTSYTLVIPSSLTVTASGWNATDGISATGTLESGKKLTVTASSGDEFALVSGENKISYTLATASTDTAATTSWEFDTLSSTATTKPMGIIVDDYSTAAAGTYTDTVTFTASVATAATGPLSPLKVNNATIEIAYISGGDSLVLAGSFSNGSMTPTTFTSNGDDKLSSWSSFINGTINNNVINIIVNYQTVFSAELDGTTYSTVVGSVNSVKVNGVEVLDQLTKN